MTSIFNHFEFFNLNSSDQLSLGYLNLNYIYFKLIIFIITLVLFLAYRNKINRPLMSTWSRIAYSSVYNHWYTVVSNMWIASTYYHKLSESKWKISYSKNKNKSKVIFITEIMGAKCLPITTKATKLFLGLAFFNLGGMILGTFCFNTWLSCTLFLSLFIWVAILIYTFQSIIYLNKQKAINHYKNPTKIDSKSPVWVIWLANFFPQGTPLWLAPLMVPIEIISYCIRPVSMGLRLCGNLVAGHVLLIIIWDVISILSASLSNINIINSSLIELTPLLLYYSLFSLELAVAIIQAYVLTLLSCTFIKEATEIH